MVTMMEKKNPFTEEEWNIIRNELKLSPRQFQIVKYLCEGHKNYSVAKKLGISVHTVKTHLRFLYSKLNVNDRFELLCLFIKCVSNSDITPKD